MASPIASPTGGHDLSHPQEMIEKPRTPSTAGSERSLVCTWLGRAHRGRTLPSGGASSAELSSSQRAAALGAGQAGGAIRPAARREAAAGRADAQVASSARQVGHLKIVHRHLEEDLLFGLPSRGSSSTFGAIVIPSTGSRCACRTLSNTGLFLAGLLSVRASGGACERPAVAAAASAAVPSPALTLRTPR